jgi:predicted ribosomally synthesized peptide with SipW-like signal peptide
MTDERFDISRRKALAALGTIGVASAGAGLGTSAYFSDQETFENNRLVAGTLDVGVGYSAHYSDWSSDEGDGVGDVNMYDGGPNETGSADELTDDYTGLPANDAWLIEVPSEDVDTFLDNTQYQSFNQENGDLMECPLDEDEQADAEERPVIDLDDVKPGDFGEVTFDFRICDNPGFVWLNGEVESASENGLTEPEADDPQEDGDADSTDPADVELLDVVQTAVWVDDGNNYQNDGEEPSVQSLRELLSSLSMGTGVPVAGNTAPEDGGGSADARNCFAGDEFHSIAFAWWVPLDHGNEIQSDSASFSLGLYTEQCRHNDGEGMAPEATPLSIDSPQGQGGGFANAWDTSETLAHVGSGSWGTIDRSGQGSYKQGFYFAGDYDNIDALPSTYTVADIEEISYWLHEPTPLDGNDIYLLIYTRPEGDGNDGGSFYDSRLVALPSNANGSSPNFTPGEWNKFSTESGASNTLVFDDSGHKPTNNVGGPSLPTLADLQGGPVDWTNYDSSLSDTYDYRNQEVLALSLQTNSTSPELEAYVDDVTVTLVNGDTLRLDLEP